MLQVRDFGITKLHECLNQVAFGIAVSIIDYLEYLARAHKVIASIRVGFVVRDSCVGVGMVIEEILLNEDTQAVSNMSWAKRRLLDQLRDGRTTLGKERDKDALFGI